MFTIDTRQIERLEKDLIKLRAKAIPFATKETINRAAFETRKVAQGNIREDMTNRNQFTDNSVRVDQARTLDIRKQEAIVGSIADYMETQEFGGSKTNPSIATGYSAGQQGARPRTRLPRKPNKLANIKLKRSLRKAKNKKQALIFKVQDAVMTGDRTFHHNFEGGKEGIFRVLGGSKSFKRGWPKGARLKMLHDMSRKSVAIPKKPWLLHATNTVTPQLNKFYASALRSQLKRHGF